jgi:hypothetical protein
MPTKVISNCEFVVVAALVSVVEYNVTPVVPVVAPTAIIPGVTGNGVATAGGVVGNVKISL